MSGLQVLVNVLGLGLIALIAWYFWFWKKPVVRATVMDGVQEIPITVKEGSGGLCSQCGSTTCGMPSY
ncbi:MAG: hypothetical protein HY335_07650 [Deinococcus sp.]|nr:hypothetical protein [Deinococcus sp.]